MASAILNKILGKVNLNTIIASVCGVAIMYLQTTNHHETGQKQDTLIVKTDSTNKSRMTLRADVDSIKYELREYIKSHP